MSSIQIYFSDYFKVDPDILDSYGALDISLINDLPMFVDPFLLFESEEPILNGLHEGLVKYVVFLKELVNSVESLPEPTIERLFYFKEVKQSWLGFSKTGNSGSGLGKQFAGALIFNLRGAFKNFGETEISSSSHIEKLTLIKEGVGRDLISDFTVSLIKKFLLEYTQEFAKKHLNQKSCGYFAIDRVEFDYEESIWKRGRFYLPKFRGDFILLTPKSILTKDKNWINREDMLERFMDIADAVPNSQLRHALGDMLIKAVKARRGISKADINDIANRIIEDYPEVMDEYIAMKERDGDQAVSISSENVKKIENKFIQNIKNLVLELQKTEFYSIPSLSNKTGANSFDEAMNRLNFLKGVIEDKDGYRIFFRDGARDIKEDDLQIMFRLTWLGSPYDVNREVNNGRGPADFIVSNGSGDKTIVEMKLGSSTSLEKNLKNQTKIYQKASDAKYSIFAVLCLDKSELEKAQGIVKTLALENAESIVLIDGSPKKISASKVKED